VQQIVFAEEGTVARKHLQVRGVDLGVMIGGEHGGEEGAAGRQ